MKRFTKIIATLGPASTSESMLGKMIMRGMDVARINFSHGDYKQHQAMINLVSFMNKKYKSKVGILQDLEGYRIRVGELRKNIDLQKDDKVYFTADLKAESSTVIPIDYDGDLRDIRRGLDVYIDDGKIHLKSLGYDSKKVKLRVIQGGIVKDRKGINIPSLKLQSHILTPKDIKDLEFGILNKVEFVAQSFVRNRKDIMNIVDRIRPYLPETKVVAKIENEEGVKNLDSIIDACDGIMIARGDLGVSLPIYKVPVIQKYIIRHCHRRKKFAITATQMLESMIDEGRPTRAEVSDVANAILDGTDYVMLSAETASGKYPSRSVQMMRQIIEYTEKSQQIRL